MGCESVEHSRRFVLACTRGSCLYPETRSGLVERVFSGDAIRARRASLRGSPKGLEEGMLLVTSQRAPRRLASSGPGAIGLRAGRVTNLLILRSLLCPPQLDAVIPCREPRSIPRSSQARSCLQSSAELVLVVCEGFRSLQAQPTPRPGMSMAPGGLALGGHACLPACIAPWLESVPSRPGVETWWTRLSPKRA